MNILNQQRCTPIKKGSAALDHALTTQLLLQLDDWAPSADGKFIERFFRFADFYRTMAFVNAVAFIAHREDHHPDMRVSFNSCHLLYTTHTIKGLSHNDFICAAHIDAVL